VPAGAHVLGLFDGAFPAPAQYDPPA
jgi:hypothetical protein